MNLKRAVIRLVLAAPFLCGGGCRSSSDDDQRGNDLDAMRTARVLIKGETFQVWIAETPDQHEKGLMFVEASQMAPLEDGTQRGMLFVFPSEARRYFWMKDTFIPLDIAYARTDGTIVSTHTMTPLDTTPFKYASGRPARFALEVTANLFAAKGIRAGEVIQIPPEVLNPGT